MSTNPTDLPKNFGVFQQQAVSPNPSKVEPDIQEIRARHAWMQGFLLLGVLLGLLGPLMIAWRYHIDAAPSMIGVHFLALSAGYLLAAGVSQRLVQRIPLRSLALAGCATGLLGLAALSFVVPPMPVTLRLLGVGLLGASAGAIATSLLYILECDFAPRTAAAVNYAGALFGTGCLIATLVVGATYFAGSVQIETAMLAVIPCGYFFYYARNGLANALTSAPRREEENRETLRDERSVAAVLFSLLLFFQCGNEWAIAGWLPLFLIHRLGTNPVWAIGVLAVYFSSLMLGRIIVRPALGRYSHRRLLFLGTFVAMTGYIILSITATTLGATLAAIIIGIGFAPIYPLLAETLDDRFSYHPGFYNGIFSVAIMGAACAPWLLGYVDAAFGIRFVMILPAFGSAVVLVLALLIMLEAHVMNGPEREEPLIEKATATGETIGSASNRRH